MKYLYSLILEEKKRNTLEIKFVY